jgi:magnesium transporter
MLPQESSPEHEPDRGGPRRRDAGGLSALLSARETDPATIREMLAAVPPAAGASSLGDVSAPRAAEVLRLVPVELAGGLLALVEPAQAAAILTHLASDDRTDVLLAVPAPERKAMAELLPPALRAEATRLLQYPPDVAGGLMETEVLAKPGGATVQEIIGDLRAHQPAYSRLRVQYLYLVDDSRRLLGVAAMRDLLLAPGEARLEALANSRPVSVRDTTSGQELADLFDTHPYQGLPVVDGEGVLLGAVNRADVMESEQHESEERYRRSQGIVGGEELRSMAVALRLRRRGTWLGINLMMSLGGAAVIAAFQDTLARAIVVAAVLPIISAASGNAAMQAAAVSVRELTLGVVRVSGWRRVLAQELLIAGSLAVLMGVAVGVLAALWGAGWVLGAAVGGAMALNVAIAVVLGALCPLVLRRWKIDPALASGPITTTLADVSGFALTLGFVAWAR